MWVGLAAGWILACVSLYVYLYATAKEAPNDQCFECPLTDCAECPYEAFDLQKRAA